MEKRQTSSVGAKKGKVSIGVYFRQYGTRAIIAELCCKINLKNGEKFRKVFAGKSLRMVSQDITDEFDGKLGRKLAFDRSMKGFTRLERDLVRARKDLQQRIEKLDELLVDMREAKEEFLSKFEKFENDGILVGYEQSNTTGKIELKSPVNS